MGYPMGDINMDDTSIRIEITFLKKGDTTPSRIELSPVEYFDPPEENENYRENGVPKYNHTWEYLTIPISELEWALEQVSGTTDDMTTRTEIFNDGRSWMSHTKDKSGHELVICDTDISDDVCHIIRIEKGDDNIWHVDSNAVIYNSGTAEEHSESFDSSGLNY